MADVTMGYPNPTDVRYSPLMEHHQWGESEIRKVRWSPAARPPSGTDKQTNE